MSLEDTGTQKKVMSPSLIAKLEQPKPKKNNLTPSFVMAMQRVQNVPELADMLAARGELGMERYGMYLQPDNGRDPFIDALQEGLDMITYLSQATTEILMKGGNQEDIDKIEKAIYMVADITMFLLEKVQEDDSNCG